MKRLSRGDLRSSCSPTGPTCLAYADPSFAVDVALTLAVGAVREIEETDDDLGAPGEGTDREQLADEVLAYLVPAQGAGEGPIELFEIWE